MDFYYFLLFLGGTTSILGLVTLSLILSFTKQNRVKNSLTALLFLLVGTGILWLNLKTLDPNYLISIDIGLSDYSTGLILISLIIGLFSLKAIQLVFASSILAPDSKLSQIKTIKSKLGIAIGLILLVWVIFIGTILFLSS
jgi:hypothetical protein